MYLLYSTRLNCNHNIKHALINHNMVSCLELYFMYQVQWRTQGELKELSSPIGPFKGTGR